MTSVRDPRISLSDFSGEEQCSLDKIQEIFGEFLEKKIFTDISLSVKHDDAWIAFPTHKLILSIWSPVLADKCYKYSGKENDNSIKIEDVSSTTFETILKFMYGSFSDLKQFLTSEQLKDISFLLAIYKAAVTYEIEALTNLCLKVIDSATLDESNVFQLLDAGKCLNCESLVQRCCKLLQMKTVEVLAAQEPCKITPPMLMTVLDMPRVSFTSEYELILWVLAWVKNRLLEDPYKKSFKQILGEFLPRMNFSKIKAEEFAKLFQKYKNDLMSEQEGFSVLMNIVLPGSHSLPSWCPSSPKHREYGKPALAPRPSATAGGLPANTTAAASVPATTIMAARMTATTSATARSVNTATAAFLTTTTTAAARFATTTSAAHSATTTTSAAHSATTTAAARSPATKTGAVRSTATTTAAVRSPSTTIAAARSTATRTTAVCSTASTPTAARSTATTTAAVRLPATTTVATCLPHTTSGTACFSASVPVTTCIPSPTLNLAFSAFELNQLEKCGNPHGYLENSTGYLGHQQCYSRNSQSNFGNPSSNFGYPQSNFGYPESNFGYPQSGFGYPESNFGYPQSGFGNPQSNFGDSLNNYGNSGNYFGDSGNNFEKSEYFFGNSENNFANTKNYLENPPNNRYFDYS